MMGLGVLALACASPGATAMAGTFEDVLSATYADNPTIRAARQQLEATDETLAQATSGFRPSISGNYNRGQQRTSFGDANFSYGQSETGQVRFTQPLFRGGATFASLKAARQQVKAGQYALESTQQRVLLDAATAYMDVVANSAVLQLARENLELHDQQLTSAQARFKVGEVTRTDVSQSESRQLDARSAVNSAEGQLLNAIASFERVVGFRPEGTLGVPEKLPELPVNLSEALIMGRHANPQLLEAIHTAKSAKFAVGTSEASLLPTVSLVGELSRQQGAGVQGNSRFDQDALTVQFAVPLYQAGAEWSRVREASAVARQRDQQSLDMRRVIDQSVTQSWNDLETAIALIGTRDAQVKVAQTALGGVTQEQQFGARTVLDVLDAQQELFNARTNLVRAQRDRIIAAYNLSVTLGQLTPANLGLSVAAYDAKAHADDVEWQPFGF